MSLSQLFGKIYVAPKIKSIILLHLASVDYFFQKMHNIFCTENYVYFCDLSDCIRCTTKKYMISGDWEQPFHIRLQEVYPAIVQTYLIF